jgi:hypothetical protein
MPDRHRRWLREWARGGSPGNTLRRATARVQCGTSRLASVRETVSNGCASNEEENMSTTTLLIILLVLFLLGGGGWGYSRYRR